MLPKKEIGALMLPTGKYWLIVTYLLLICLSILTLCVLLGVKYHKLWISLIGVPLFIIPAIFFTLKINLFAKKATINFSEEFIEINGTGTFDNSFAYSDIKYFSVSDYSVDNASLVKIILRNGTKKRYVFFKQIVNDDNILNNFLSYFSAYNTGKKQEDKIQILPSFYLTKGGKLFITITAISIVAAIILQIIYKRSTVPASLVAVLGGYMQVKVIQMRDKKILEKFRDEN